MVRWKRDKRLSVGGHVEGLRCRDAGVDEYCCEGWVGRLMFVELVLESRFQLEWRVDISLSNYIFVEMRSMD